jgi:glycosyltransferase involved in cell wall biosynthesis
VSRRSGSAVDVVVQGSTPDYRVALFSLLRERDDVPLDLVVGDEHFDPTVRTTDDPVVTKRIRNHWLVGRRLLAQPAAVRPGVRARTTVLEFNPRIITTWVIAGVRRALRRPTVVWGHVEGQGGSSPPPLRRPLGLARLAGTLAVYTEPGADAARRSYPGVAVVAAPNGIYRAADAVPVRTDGPAGTAFVSCGRLVESKGVGDLLDAFVLATRHGLGSDATLEFVGSGPLESTLRQRAIDAGLDDRVHFHGAIDALDVAALQSVFDGAVASVSAGYVGLNVIQSMWFGIPMVTVREAPHSPEIDALVDGWNGVLVDPSTPAGLADAMTRAWGEREVWLSRRSDIAAETRARHGVETTVDGLAAAMVRARNRPRRRTGTDLLVAGPFPPPLTGAADVTERMTAALEDRGVVCRRLDVSHAGPSRIRRLGRRLTAAAAGAATMLAPRAPRAVYVSVPETWSMLGFVPVVLAARGRHRTVVLHHEIQTYMDPTSPHRFAARALFAASGRHAMHLALTDGMSDALRPLGVRDVRVVSNAWCLPVAGPETPAPPLPTTIGFLSNITLRKGVDTVLATFDDLLRHRPDAQLVLAGPCDDTTAPIVATAAERPEITYLGPVDPAARDRFLAGLHVFVFPTRNPEGQGNVIIEANRAGVPVVATDVGFVRDTVGDGGIVLAPNDWTDRAVDAVLELTGPDASAWRDRSRAQFEQAHAASLAALDEFAQFILSRRT